MKHSPSLPIHALACHPHHRQRGFTTLAIGLIILVMASLMSIYASRSGILDIRSSADRVRYTQALDAAEERVEAAVSWMRNNKTQLDPTAWANTCTDGSLTPPCGDYNSNRYGAGFKFLNQTVTVGGAPLAFSIVARNNANALDYDIVALGTSDDGTAQVVAKQGMFFYNLLGGGTGPLPAPFVAAGNIDFQGSFSIVANPNGAGTGVPVSVWTPNNSDLENEANAKTCHMQEFLDNGSTGCPNDAKLQLCSNNTGVACEDEVDNDPNFPNDVFAQTFDVSSCNYLAIKDQATKLNDCTSLDANSGVNQTYYWVTGNCSISAGTQVGSAANPIILIVQPGNGTAGNIQMNGGARLYGILMAFDPPDSAASCDPSANPPYAADSGDMDLNGGAQVFGAVISNDTTNAGQTINGTFNLVYDLSVLGKLAGTGSTPPGPGSMGIAKAPGTWTDYLR